MQVNEWQTEANKGKYNIGGWLSFKELNETNCPNCSILLASNYQTDPHGSYTTKISFKNRLKHPTMQLYNIIKQVEACFEENYNENFLIQSITILAITKCNGYLVCTKGHDLTNRVINRVRIAGGSGGLTLPPQFI